MFYGDGLASFKYQKLNSIAMSPLSEYVQKLLKQGYAKDNIRQTLTAAGYTDQEIDLAFARHITPLSFTIAIGALFLTVIAIFLLLGRTPDQPLSLSIDVLTPKVTQGDTLALAVHITNPNERRINAIIKAIIKSPSGKTITEQKTATAGQQTSIPISIALPNDAEIGRYSLEVKLEWKKQTKYQTTSFEVIKQKVQITREQREQKAETAQKTCSSGCDDQNFCTTDTCNEGACVNTPIIPCCGNGKCEQEEECLPDCTTKTTSEDIKTEALAQTDLEQATTICASLAQQTYIDECLIEVAEKSENKQACEEIVSDDLRDSCYIPFAYKKDFTVCEKVVNQALKNSCITLQQIS